MNIEWILREQSKALKVFQSAKQDLENCNAEYEKAIDSVNAEVERLKGIALSAQTQVDYNKKVLENFKGILNL